jgi:hypothetical protein
MNAGWLNNYRRSRISRLVDMDSDLDRELVVNGDFATGDLTGWSTVAPATIAYSGGTCRITRNSAAIGTDMCYQDIDILINNYYILKYDFVYQSTTATRLSPYLSYDGGTTDIDTYNHDLLFNNLYYTFLATGNSLRLIFKCTNNLTGVVGFDNVSLKRIIYSP